MQGTKLTRDSGLRSGTRSCIALLKSKMFENKSSVISNRFVKFWMKLDYSVEDEITISAAQHNVCSIVKTFFI